MHGAPIGGEISVELARQAFKPSKALPDLVWMRGRKSGRMFTAYLNPAGTHMTVTENGPLSGVNETVIDTTLDGWDIVLHETVRGQR